MSISQDFPNSKEACNHVPKALSSSIRWSIHISDCPPWVQSLGWDDFLEKGMAATHSSILAWRIPWTEEPGGLQSMGSQRVRHDWVTFTFFPPQNQDSAHSQATCSNQSHLLLGPYLVITTLPATSISSSRFTFNYILEVSFLSLLCHLILSGTLSHLTFP